MRDNIRWRDLYKPDPPRWWEVDWLTVAVWLGVIGFCVLAWMKFLEYLVMR